MSKSAILAEEETWAQTFVTVTPQEDGSLREIEETCVVSGSPDVPLNLDTWNIVLRRSLMNTTRDLIDPRELGKSERVAAECQTYLQGVPKVELPFVYRDEATQTLYIGRDAPCTETMQNFDDIIAVMNEKTLPEWKISKIIQTVITFESEPSYEDLVKTLQTDIQTESTVKDSTAENATMEASDFLNFVIDRTLWMRGAASMPKGETTEVEVATVVKYDHRSNKLTIDHEVQTSLSCEPRYSNSMLLSTYNANKFFCQERIEECMKKGVYSRIAVDKVLNEVIEKSQRQIDFPSRDEDRQIHEDTKQIFQNDKTVCLNCTRESSNDRSLRVRHRVPDLSCRRTEDILLADKRSYVVRTRAAAAQESHLKAACSSSTKDIVTMSSTSSKDSFFSSSKDTLFCESRSTQEVSNSRGNLSSPDEKVLECFKKAFCGSDRCS